MIDLIKKDKSFVIDVDNLFGFNEIHNLYFTRTKNGFVGYVDVVKKGDWVDFVVFDNHKNDIVLIDRIDLIIPDNKQRVDFINKSKIIDYRSAR